MKSKRILQMALRALGHNKSRAFLTMLGVIIGVSSVIMMLSIGAGTQQSVTGRISALGTNLLTVQPGFQRSGGVATSNQARSLTLADAEAIRNLEGVNAAAPVVSTRTQAIVGENNTNTSVVGTTPEYQSSTSIEMSSGNFFAQIEVDQWDTVVVLGSTVAEDLFAKSNPIGQTVQLVVNRARVNCRVLGVMASKGGGGFGSQDDRIVMPITTVQKLLTGSKNVNQISVEAVSTDQMTAVSNRITQLLRVRHDIQPSGANDFSIMNQEDLLSTATEVTGIFTALLAGIAGVSLLVGGIGIMNIMLVSVTERTREIGLRKAIGALRRDIVAQFLVEAVLLATAGGILGIGLGFLGAYLIASFAGFPAAVTWNSVLLGLLFSMGVGVFFGYYPAQRAASLKPIDALRYE
jgi:putative ABC transport system permease protein